MAITDITVPYEILIRFGEDGAPHGAHVQRRRIVELDGERLKDEVLPAEPLALEGFPTSAIMTGALQEALVRIQQLQDQIEAMAAELDTASALGQQAEAQIATLNAQIEALQVAQDFANARAQEADLQS
ncbi:hypothetical protein FFK22_024740 [Mycobacterium sp. KBS0706]|uniref:hypothetical protein n=1 Tax=Mycobacterium sp. KBS0706 TaxID=2578109 RepID=UPI00110F9C10|nr:hypothetical protein [Mycobacterium sp. KBS0706]TSD86029.1 hypothetical protein FFK22_024740 [Mycobacterium sp. KBS0706]